LVGSLPDLARVKEALRAAGYKYLVHDSCLVSPRLFVLVSDAEGKFDQWILLNLTKTAGDASRRLSVDVAKTLSFIAVQKTDDAGQRLPKVRLHFRDYSIASRSDGGYGLELHPDVSTKCAACHPSGVRQLMAQYSSVLEAAPVRGEAGFVADQAPEPSSDFARARLAEFNGRLLAYGLNDWNGLFTPGDQGPLVGKDEGCTACHNGQERGVLTVLTSEVQLEEKIFYELAMPPTEGLPELLQRSRSEGEGRPLSGDERAMLEQASEQHRALSARVIAGRSAALAAWLLSKSCR
jgi:hypothetical protein